MKGIILALTLAICIVKGFRDLYVDYRTKKARERRAKERAYLDRANVEKQRERRRREREEQAKQNNLKEYYNSSTLSESDLNSLFMSNIEQEEPKGCFYHNDFNEFFSIDEHEEEVQAQEEEVIIMKVPNEHQCVLDDENFFEENTYNFRKKHGLLSVEELEAGRNLPLDQRNTTPVKTKDHDCSLPHHTHKPTKKEGEEHKVVPFRVC